MRYALLDRSFQCEPRRFQTVAAAGLAMLEIASRRWFVKRRRDVQTLMVPEGKPLHSFGLYVASGGGRIELAGSCYSKSRAGALSVLLAAASKRAWPGTPAAHLHVIELTAYQVRIANRTQRA